MKQFNIEELKTPEKTFGMFKEKITKSAQDIKDQLRRELYFEHKTQKNNEQEHIVYSGKIFEIRHTEINYGHKKIIFEKAHRAPGVRLLIIQNDRILITKEYRKEHNSFDYRLPGGKVFDSLQRYLSFIKKQDNMLDAAKQAAQKECQEETGLIPLSMKHIYTTSPSATVEWDLFYFLIEHIEEHPSGQNLDFTEKIYPEWHTFADVKEMCLTGKITEERTALVLLRFLSEKGFLR